MSADTPLTTEKKRYYTLDSVRGICVLGMIIYHALFDVVYFFDLKVNYTAYLVSCGVRDFGAALFIFMSGLCFLLGKKHLRHVTVLSVLGAAISLVTHLVMPELTIIFGIFTFMGVACALMCLLQKPFSHLPAIPCAVISGLLFFVFLSVNFGYIGYGEFRDYAPLVLADFPAALYKNYFTAFLGFPFPGFESGDYFSLLPWIFAYFCGYFTGRAAIGTKLWEKIAYIKLPFIEKTGKLSMYIYVVHQPVIYGIVWLIQILLHK